MPNNFIHPDKMNWINSGDPEINALLPKLSEKEHTYLQLITNDSYKALVANLKKYLGIYPSNEDIPQLMGTLFAGVKKAMQLEAKSKAQLEELALNTVLGIEEFHMVQEAYINGDVTFKIELARPNIQDYKMNEEPPAPGELSEEETINAELAELFSNADLDDSATRRRFANLLITGGAFSKMYLFHLVESKLTAINPELPKLYGALGALAELGYWVASDGFEGAAASGGAASAGVEEVIPDGDKYIIKAKAITFPYLIHEIVKGVYEWLSIDPEMKRLLGKEKIEHETRDVLAGPALFKKVIGMVPSDKQQYMPSIQKKLISLPTIDTQEILKQTPRGQSLFNELIAQAEDEWEQYKQDKSDYMNQ